MSSFIVSNQTITDIINGLHAIDRDTRHPAMKLGELGYDVHAGNPKGYTARGQAMLDLNVRAVNERYQDKETADAPYRHSSHFTNKMQAYKSLRCWLYQCSEGTVPQSPLFKVFDEHVREAFADYIITRLPEYEAAKWSA